MISVSVKRKQHGKGLQGIIDGLPGAARDGVAAAGEGTHKLAVKFARGRVAKSIDIEIIDANTFEPYTRIHTTSPFAAFLEYGTGIHMDENPLGHIPGSAGDRGVEWYVHEDMADLSKYNFPVVQTVNPVTGHVDRYYVLVGTHPHPYMRPAAFDRRDKNVEEVANAIREMIRSVT